jgi:hypothetical protein
LVEPLRATVTSKVNEGAVKQQVERNDELIRSALRAVASIAKLPNVEANQKFDEFLKQTVMIGGLAERYAQVAAEEAASNTQHHLQQHADAMDTSV